MLQNRVDPFGTLIKTSARGYWMGNRGLIHNEQQQIVRSFKLKAWLICRLQFKGRARKVMSPNLYTELFFLDEATAFAAGHRPCCECRREDFNRFKKLWLTGNPAHAFTEKIPIRNIDYRIHEERINIDDSKKTVKVNTGDIPDGAFVAIGDKAYLVYHKQAFLWSPFGYEKGIAMPASKTLTVLTPASVINTFRAGYLPQIDTTAFTG